MAAATDTPNAHRWADIVALIAGVSLIATSIWPTDFTVDPGVRSEAINPGLLVPLHIGAGTVAILAVVVAQRGDRRGLARLMLVAAAAALLIGLAVFRDFGVRAIVTMVLPALALLATTVGIGAMPTNED